MSKSQLALKLNVFLNTRQVGYIQRQNNGAIEFNYDDSWLNFDKALPISLSLPLRAEKYIGDAINVVLDNLLPDNKNIRRQIATKMGAKSNDVIDLLAVLGHDCVGALRFILDTDINVRKEMIEGKPLSEEQIADKIKNLKNSPLGIDVESEFRISIAGAQEKTALLYFNEQWMEPIGATATTHIFKPQIGKLPNGIDLSQSVENEHFCLEFIKNLGFACAKSRIIDFTNVRTLVVERFDRLWTNDGRLLRLPQEDCCQAFGISSTQKYENNGGPGISDILNLLNMSDDALLDREFFFKTQIVYWLLAATDAHAKNYSIALYPGGKFRLTPLYDVMTVQPYFDLGQIRQTKMKMAMAVKGKEKHYEIHEIIPRHFIETGKINGFSMRDIENMFTYLIAEIPKALEKTANDLFKLVPENIINSIRNGVKERLLLIQNL
jgi:serine/threonine-protein kinase HipA